MELLASCDIKHPFFLKLIAYRPKMKLQVIKIPINFDNFTTKYISVVKNKKTLKTVFLVVLIESFSKLSFR